MNINIEQYENKAVIAIIGRVGADNAHQLRKEFRKLEEDITEVTIDAKGLQYISSSGLRELLILKKGLPKDSVLRMIHCNDIVKDTLITTSFDNFIEIISDDDYLSGKSFFSFKTMLKTKAEKRGDCPALWENGSYLTWNDIEKYSQIIASDLDKLGVKKGSHVAICGKNSINWVLTFFAIQKLGAIAMLLNVQLKPSEINSLTEIGDIEFFCHGNIPIKEQDEAYLEKVMNSSITADYDFGSSIDFCNREKEYEDLIGKYEDVIEADDPCIFLFTSGSTGTPKGIIHTAYGLLNSAYALGHRFRLSETDRSYLVLPLYHVLGFMDSFITVLLYDGIVYIAPDTRTNSMLEIISEHKCTLLHCVPTIILALTNNERFVDYDLSSIRMSLLGGAPMLPAQMEMVQKRLPENHFVSGYGLSEMAPACNTLYEDSKDHLLNSIGLPLPCTKAKVQNPETGDICSIGEEGELLLQGINMMLCYYKLDIDKQCIDSEGWLHTGDLVSMDIDGYLHFKGRLKELIIRGGENIMPNEIAAALVTHPQIHDAKVIGAPHPVLGEEVVACIVPEGDSLPDAEEVNEYLKDKLAHFKIPSKYVFYREFPLLANGKIDAVNLKKDMLSKI